MKDYLQKKIKITYIMPSLDSGGAERFIVDLLLNLDQKIFLPTLILFKRGGPWIKELESRGIKVLVFRKQSKFDLYNFWIIWRSIKKIQPQIVHTQLGGDLYGRLVAKLLGVPIIIRTEQNINNDENLITRWFKRISRDWDSRIIAISKAVKQDAIYRYHLSPKKIEVIPNGLNLEKFPQKIKSAATVQKEKIIFGTLGRLVKQKDQMTLIKAWSLLKNQRAVCLIAGQGPLHNQLNREIKRLNLNQRIKLVGPINNPSSWLVSLDAFLFPSQWEGQGLALLEAGLTGLPVIASPVDGVKELINDANGFTAKTGNAAAWAEKIDYLAEHLDSLKIASKSQALREQIINNYDIKKISAVYSNLYKRLLKDKNLV